VQTRERGDGEAKEEVDGKAYHSKLLINGPELGVVSCVRPAALQDLVSPFDPALCRRLAKVDLLSFVSARIGIEVNSGDVWSAAMPSHLFGAEQGKVVSRRTHCFNSALACSSGPPEARGTVTSAAQLRMCWPSMAHCRSAAQPSV